MADTFTRILSSAWIVVLAGCMPVTHEVRDSLVRSWSTLEPDEAASTASVPMCRTVQHVEVHREAVESRSSLSAKQSLIALAAGAGLTLAGAGVGVAAVAQGHQDPPGASVSGLAPVIGGLAGTGLSLLFFGAFSKLSAYEKHADWGTRETAIAGEDVPCPPAPVAAAPPERNPL